MFISVLIGFGPSYYFAGLVRAPLPSIVIHIHAVVFSTWILLLIAQTSLTAVGRIEVHRRLGIAGFFLACVMIVVGPLAATDGLLRRAGPPGRDVEAFYIIPLTDILVFAVLIFSALYYRSKSPIHKRLVLVASTALMTAAIARWHFELVHRKPAIAMRFGYLFVLALIAYDLWALRKVHRATWMGGAFLIFVEEIRIPISKTAEWHAFATWVETVARHTHFFR